MEFLHPEYLYLLLLLLPLIVWYVVRLSKTQASFKLASADAFRAMKPDFRVTMRHLPFALRLISLGLIIIVIARPQSVSSWEETESQGIDIVMALDVSGSMLAQDLQPDRLQAAKKVAAEFITDRRNDNIGLVSFCRGELYAVPAHDRSYRSAQPVERDQFRCNRRRNGDRIGAGHLCEQIERQ